LRLGARARLHRPGVVPAPALDRRPATVRAGRGGRRARVRHQTQLVTDMLDRALAAGVPFRYFTADSGYGRDPALRARCHTAALAYVLAVPVDLPLVAPGAGATRPDQVLATVPKAVWERRSCGQGTKGERFYDWVAVAV